MTQRVREDPIEEESETRGEVVLGEPCGDLPVLHIGPSRHVDEEIAQAVPVSHNVHTACAHFGVLKFEKIINNKGI